MAFRIQRPQQVYRVETIASTLASELGSKGEEVIGHNQGIVKAIRIKGKTSGEWPRLP